MHFSRQWFPTTEGRFFSTLSVVSLLVSLLFIAEQVKSLVFLRFGLGNDSYYLFFLVIGILFFSGVGYFAKTAALKKWLGLFLGVFLPSELALSYGLSQSTNFHYLFNIGTGLYAIFLAFFLVRLFYEKKRNAEEPRSEGLTPKEWFRSQGLFALLFVFAITASFLSFALKDFTKFAAVDEPLWYGRIPHYWHNIEDRDWKGTNISDKPGITVALTAGIGLWFETPKEYRSIRASSELIRTDKQAEIENLYFAFRLPVILFATLLLPLFYFFLERLIGKTKALFSYAFIGLSPPLIGIVKIINPDSYLWIFAPLSFLAYLLYRKSNRFRYLIAAGILFGLALLTKYVANIVLVFLLGLVFLEYLFLPKETRREFSEHLKRSLSALFVFIITALSLFWLLFPAVWVKPKKLFTGTLFSEAFESTAPIFLGLLAAILLDQWFNRSRGASFLISFFDRWKEWIVRIVVILFGGSVLFVLWNSISGMSPYDFQSLLSSPKTIANRSDFVGIFLTNFYPLLFGLTPLTLLFLLGAPFFLFRKSSLEKPSYRLLFFILVFILLYSLGATLNNVGMIVRYQIMLFPLAAIGAGIVAGIAFSFLKEKISFPFEKKFFFPGILVAVFGIGIVSLANTPFPLSYASSILPNRYHTDVKDMGPGSYEAAMYLNSLPDAENLLIWTDKDGVCRFFVGRCKRSFNFTNLKKEGLDYIVVSSARKNRTTSFVFREINRMKPDIIRFDTYYDRMDPDFELKINGRDSHFVKVFKWSEATLK